MPRRRKSKVSTSRRKRTALSILGGVFFAAALGFFVLFLWIDQTVSSRLALRTDHRASAILTDFYTLPAFEAIDEESLREELRARNYVEVDRTPQEPGEYRIHQESLTLMTRPFRLPDGSRNSVERTERSLRAVEGSAPPRSPLVLEPRVVSYLGATRVRATTYRRLSEIPPHLIHAVIAVEDERFYSHFGVDLIGIVRALIVNVKKGGFIQGGSTITQQLAKNLFFSAKKTLSRKALEAIAALSIEWHLTKDEILELYLNEVYLGQDGVVAFHGVGEASQALFQRPVDTLSVGQSALIAGLIRAPSAYNPWRNPERARDRQFTVLARMREHGSLSQAEYAAALAEGLSVSPRPPTRAVAPHFVAAVRRELETMLDVDSATVAGARVITGLHLAYQNCAEQSVEAGILELEKSYPSIRRKDMPVEVGLVSLDPSTGKIRAWVGGRSFTQNQFDHVNQARRQVGSTIKPFLYLTALDRNLNRYRAANPTSVIPDEPVTIQLPSQDSWDPKNFDNSFHGDVTLRFALENSLNLAAVYLSQRVGLQSFADVVRRFRISHRVQEVPSLALGAIETTLLDLTAAYGALAYGGVYVAPRLFTVVVDGGEKAIATSTVAETSLADENAVFVLTDILSGVVNRGTGQSIRARGYTGPAAGKTGTSDEARDAWFVGYTPALATGVWIGFDDNRKLGLTGGVAAAPIWANYMKCVQRISPQPDFVRPSDVVVLSIDSSNGMRATDTCDPDLVVQEVFVRGTEPQRSCDKHFGADLKDLIWSESPKDEGSSRRRERSFWKLLFGER